MSKTRDTEAPHALEVVPDVGHFLHIEAPRRSRNGSRHGPSSGSLVQAEVRTVDNVARFGGGAFVVLLRETDLGNAFLLAERLRQQISGGASVPSA